MRAGALCGGIAVFLEGFFAFFVGLASFADIVNTINIYDCRGGNRLLFRGYPMNARLPVRPHVDG